MTSRQNSRKQQPVLRMPFSLTARQPENNSKLANLLSLSQFNIDDAPAKNGVFFGKPSYNLRKNQEPKCIIRPDNTCKEGPANHPRRSRSSRRNILSCQQILNLAKKRQTCPFVSLESSKPKKQAKHNKKCRKQQSHSVNPKQAKSPGPIDPDPEVLRGLHAKGYHSALNAYSGEHQAEEVSQNNLVINYPLSASHSYIIFSDRENSPAGTSKVTPQAIPPASPADLAVGQGQGPLGRIRQGHAATVIQKYWRGYLTRRLLQDYIRVEEPKLRNKLTSMQASNSCLGALRGLGDSGRWDSPKGESLELSEIRSSGQGRCNKQQKQSDHGSTSPDKSKQLEQQSKYHNSELINNEQQHTSIFSPSAGPTRHLLPNRGCAGSRGGAISSRGKLLRMQSAFNLEVRCSGAATSLLPDEQLQEQLQRASANITRLLGQKIEAYKACLGEQVKQSKLDFKDMLDLRLGLKGADEQLKTKLEVFRAQVHQVFSKVPTTLSADNPPSRQSVHINQFCPSAQSSAAREADEEQPCAECPSSPSANKQSHTPMSECFTIELPTEELSPHKNSPSCGIATLNTYIEYLANQFHSLTEPLSETAYICGILRKQSELGVQNMVERCLVQMLVEMLTAGLSIACVAEAARSILDSTSVDLELPGQVEGRDFVSRWAAELDKWELGVIEEVSRNMEESADVTEKKLEQGRKIRFPYSQFYAD